MTIPTHKCLPIALAALFIVVGGMLHDVTAGESAPLFTKDELKAILGTPDTFVLDVRTGRDWSSSEFKIKGAHRADPGDHATWASKYPKTATIVLYCA